MCCNKILINMTLGAAKKGHQKVAFNVFMQKLHNRHCWCWAM